MTDTFKVAGFVPVSNELGVDTGSLQSFVQASLADAFHRRFAPWEFTDPPITWHLDLLPRITALERHRDSAIAWARRWRHPIQQQIRRRGWVTDDEARDRYY